MNIEFQGTREVVQTFLDHLVASPDGTSASIISSYLDAVEVDASQPMDWRYYYIKYPRFRVHKEGYFFWEDRANRYECVMINKRQFNGFHWSPFLYEIQAQLGSDARLEDYGAPLIFSVNGVSLMMENMQDGYKVSLINTEQEGTVDLMEKLHTLGMLNKNDIHAVEQNPEGIDTEDRVVKGVALVQSLLNIGTRLENNNN